MPYHKDDKYIGYLAGIRYSGIRCKERHPATCSGCGVTFMLKMHEDLPCPNPCTRYKKKRKNKTPQP